MKLKKGDRVKIVRPKHVDKKVSVNPNNSKGIISQVGNDFTVKVHVKGYGDARNWESIKWIKKI